MAADGVVGLVFAAEAVCATGVNDEGAAAGGLCQHFGGIDDQFGAWTGGEAAGWRCFDAAAGGKAGGGPGAPAAVEDGDGLVSDPAQHPPHACGHAAAAVIVEGDLGVVADAEASECRGESRCIGQGMAAGAARHDWPGHVVVQMGVYGAGYVAFCVLPGTLVRVGQGESGVDHAPVRVLIMAV